MDHSDKCRNLRKWTLSGSGRLQSIWMAIVAVGALAWILLRVIPKPSRITYPCVRAASSLASTAIVQAAGIAFSLWSLARAKSLARSARYVLAAGTLLVGFFVPLLFQADAQKSIAAYQPVDLPANQPIGRAKGIFPGRVVWAYDSMAVNQRCNPSLNNHGWFLPENSTQSVVDNMLSNSLKLLTGQTTDSSAWSAIFKFHNVTRGKGSVGYVPGERVFIKINVTSSWSGNINPTTFAKIYNSQYYGISETSPPLVLAVLRQLVNVVGVQQSDLYVGDPLKHIYKHSYDLWHAEFPNVHYLDHDGGTGREKVVPSPTAVIHFSDKGTVLHLRNLKTPVLADSLYSIFESAEYMINIPMLKGHEFGGMTMFAKNHFGSQTRSDAYHLHNGLVAPSDAQDTLRQHYGMYRVQVDLMGHRLLGGKTLVYIMDALWATDWELGAPVKWTMAPFNNRFMSSVFASLDPVAIESVGYDFLRSEFTPARGLNTYVQMPAVDDYLHQAADSTTWPPTITYDPDGSGTAVPSLGVHEHWNNAQLMQYTRNLGTGTGIELVKAGTLTSVEQAAQPLPATFFLSQNYPNPFNPTTNVRFRISEFGFVKLAVYDLTGRVVAVLVNEAKAPGEYTVQFNGSNLSSGVYFCRLAEHGLSTTRKLVLAR